MKTESRLESAVASVLFGREVMDHPRMVDVIDIDDETFRNAVKKAVKQLRKRIPFDITVPSFKPYSWRLDYVTKAASGKLVHVDVRSEFTHDYSDADTNGRRRNAKTNAILRDYIKDILLSQAGVDVITVYDAEEARKLNYRLGHR